MAGLFSFSINSNSRFFTFPGIKIPLSSIFKAAVNVPSPLPLRKRPFPASYEGVSISALNIFPPITTSKLSSPSKSQITLSIIGAN